MPRVLVCLITIVTVCPGSAAAQAGPGRSQGGTRIDACALMPRALMEKVTPRPVNKIVFDLKAHGEPLGEKGSSCHYATTELQIDPFARADAMRRDSPGKDWQRLTGVGDAAYFHNNDDQYAELMVWTGAHHFTIQMDVPNGSTSEAVKPNTIALANAIIDGLRR